MSKTISINAGSSTLKFQLFEMPSEEVIAKGVIERIGLKDSLVDIKYGDGQRLQETIQASNHEIAINYLLDQLLKLSIISDFSEITGVGHRVVAGGEYFKDSVVIDDDVMKKLMNWQTMLHSITLPT